MHDIRDFKNILSFLKHIPLSESNEDHTLDNIDSYILKLQSLMTNGIEEHQQLIKEVKTIMRQLQNSLANGITPVVTVKSNALFSTPNSTVWPPFILTASMMMCHIVNNISHNQNTRHDKPRCCYTHWVPYIAYQLL